MMMKLDGIFVWCLIIIGYSAQSKVTNNNSLLEDQRKLNEVIQSVVGSIHPQGMKKDSIRKYSFITDLCSTANFVESNDTRHSKAKLIDDDILRIVCCTPEDVRHLYNVLFENQKIVGFTDVVNKKKVADHHLPPVTSVKKQRKENFNLPLESRTLKTMFQDDKRTNGKDSPCKSFFNGTLHVIGASTMHNVYHAVGDNLLPLIAQIVLDAYLSPQYLYLPRMLLIHNPQMESMMSWSKGQARGVPHMELIGKLMSGGGATLKQVNGMCFSRVVWGHGPHVLYQDTTVALRRLTAEFARKLVFKFYNISFPSVFWLNATTGSGSSVAFRTNLTSWQVQQPTASVTAALQSDRKIALYGGAEGDSNKQPNSGPVPVVAVTDRGPLYGLNVVFYTRGSSGSGRSMQGEDLLLRRLAAEGANVVYCCEFSLITIEQQLALALHADVIMGLHGAAIVHGIFMRRGAISIEWKTLYGYDSNLFSLVSDARVGLHGQVDVRKYFIRGGHRPVDASLVTRSLAVLREALILQQETAATAIEETEEAASNSSFVYRTLDTSAYKNSPAGSKAAHTPWDFVCRFPNTYSDPSVMHLLGPFQENHNQVCNALPFAKLRFLLGVITKDSFHCDICRTYVVRR